MKLHIKLIICYVVTIFAVFFCVNFAGNRILKAKIMQDLKDEYYRDIQRIAQVYTDYYFDENVRISQVRSQMKLFDDLISARIWIVNAARIVVIDTRGATPVYVDDYSNTLLKQMFS